MNNKSIYDLFTPGISPEFREPISSYWFIFSESNLLVTTNNEIFTLPLVKNLEELGLSTTREHYLGTFNDIPCFTCEVDPTLPLDSFINENSIISSGKKSSENSDVLLPNGMEFINLRSLFGLIDDTLFELAGKAIQIVTWDQTHQFCGRCGSKVEQLPNERAKHCPSCNLINYPRISPATITAIFKGNKILLAHAKHFPGDMHSLIAGFLEPGETLEDCVRREIKEEVNIHVKNITYWGSQPWPYPNSMMIGFTADYDSGQIQVDGIEIEKADWYDIHSLPELPSKVSIARKIIDWYIQQHTQKTQDT